MTGIPKRHLREDQSPKRTAPWGNPETHQGWFVLRRSHYSPLLLGGLYYRLFAPHGVRCRSPTSPLTGQRFLVAVPAFFFIFIFIFFIFCSWCNRLSVSG